MELLFWLFIYGLACSLIANNKNRNVYAWFVLGVLFSLFAVIIVALLPKLED